MFWNVPKNYNFQGKTTGNSCNIRKGGNICSLRGGLTLNWARTQTDLRYRWAWAIQWSDLIILIQLIINRCFPSLNVFWLVHTFFFSRSYCAHMQHKLQRKNFLPKTKFKLKTTKTLFQKHFASIASISRLGYAWKRRFATPWFCCSLVWTFRWYHSRLCCCSLRHHTLFISQVQINGTR